MFLTDLDCPAPLTLLAVSSARVVMMAACVQALQRELQDYGGQLLEARAAHTTAQGQLGVLQHEVGGLRFEVSEERRQRLSAQALVKEYEGGVSARCAPGISAPLCQLPPSTCSSLR
jgi:uncharacterized protein YbgA (DUF1722 family)